MHGILTSKGAETWCTLACPGISIHVSDYSHSIAHYLALLSQDWPTDASALWWSAHRLQTVQAAGDAAQHPLSVLHPSLVQQQLIHTPQWLASGQQHHQLLGLQDG